MAIRSLVFAARMDTAEFASGCKDAVSSYRAFRQQINTETLDLQPFKFPKIDTKTVLEKDSKFLENARKSLAPREWKDLSRMGFSGGRGFLMDGLTFQMDEDERAITRFTNNRNRLLSNSVDNTSSYAATKWTKGFRSGARALSAMAWMGGSSEAMAPVTKIASMAWGGQVAFDAFSSASKSAGMALGIFGVGALAATAGITALVEANKNYDNILQENRRHMAEVQDLLDKINAPKPEVPISPDLKTLTEQRELIEKELRDIRPKIFEQRKQLNNVTNFHPVRTRNVLAELMSQESDLTGEWNSLSTKIRFQKASDASDFFYGPLDKAIENVRSAREKLEGEVFKTPPSVTDTTRAWLGSNYLKAWESRKAILDNENYLFSAAKKTADAMERQAKASENAAAALKGLNASIPLIGKKGGEKSFLEADAERRKIFAETGDWQLADKTFKARERYNAAQANANREASAESIKQANRTPFEVFKDQLVETQNLFKTGFLGEGDFSAAAERLMKGLDLSGATSTFRPQEFQSASAYVSTDYYRSETVKDEQKILMRQQLEKLSEQIPILKQIADKLGI